MVGNTFKQSGNARNMPSSSRSRGSGRGPDGTQRGQCLAPMSERQQLALVMQISSQDDTQGNNAGGSTPAEERKKSRQQRNVRGETPLHVAAIRGDSENVKKLLNQGQDPNAPDFAGWTPLHEACSYGWYDVVEILVNNGADPNAKGLDDDTPLHDATTSGNLKMVQFLIDHGADPFARNTKGKMPSDYAATHILDYLQSLKDNNARASSVGRARDDSSKKGNASTTPDCSKRTNMESLAQGDHFDGKDSSSQEKESTQINSSVVSSTQDEAAGSSKRSYPEEKQEPDVLDEELAKRKKKSEEKDKELMGKPAPVSRSGPGRKPPGPASKTGAAPLGKGSQGKGSSSGKVTSQGKGGSSKQSTSHQGKSGSGKGSGLGKQDRKSPVASPKNKDDDGDDNKTSEASAPKVPPLKIVIPGGGAAGRNDQEGEGQRGGGKGRGGASTLPYVIPCTTDAGQTSDSSDGNCDDKRGGDGGKVCTPKPGQRVLRSHKTNEDKDKERTSPHANANKSPNTGQDDHTVSSSRNDPELHPRKRKLKASKESHRDSKHGESAPESSAAHNVTHSNPYQMYLHIRSQIDRRQRALFPVKPKPPKDFKQYLMNRCTYTLQSNVEPEPQVEIPRTLPPQMASEYTLQEKERTRLRIQHLVEKEKLVLAVEQEILRVHGRAERAVANQPLPYSVCTMLRDREVYNVLAPEQEEKRNAQRSRCNGRQINSWLQEVDDKWEKIKEGMLRRQHTEAQTLHAVQIMGWEWKLKELGLCDYKTAPKIDPTHVPQLHVSNFDLPA